MLSMLRIRQLLVKSLGSPVQASLASTSRGMSSLGEEKKALRKQTRQALHSVDLKALRQQSQQVCNQVLSSKFCSSSTNFGVYLTCERFREVDAMPLVDYGLQHADEKTVFVPVVDDKLSNMRFLHLDSKDGLDAKPPFGIMEPSNNYANGSPRQNVMQMDKPLEVLFLPGVAFDRRGRRLGRGGGYYDKFLTRCLERADKRGWEPPLLVALAFKEMLAEKVPAGENDRSVDAVATADEIIACSSRAAERLQ